jgi:lysophospholipase L1-like esterase
VDEKGMLRQGFADDGLHPNARGYARITPVAAAAIQQVLR